MTREEAKEVFLNRGFIKVDSGTVYYPDKWRDACVIISEWLEQEPSEDCVSRKAVYETIDDCNSDGLKGIFCSYDDGERFKEYIKKLPLVTPTRNVGKWIGHGEHCENLGVIPSGLGAYEWCSNCDCGIDVREWHRNHYNYCPNCGAEMESEE